jgi:protein-disulfide isomerase-like protein with CxxC motif
MSYSLIEPLQEAGFKVNNLDVLTGLAEYRNGGLFIDSQTISIKDRTQLEIIHDLKSPLIVEWRALTVVLLDKLAEQIRLQTSTNSDSMPLASILQGGTWSAGRRIAQKLRANGSPPLNLNSRGTIF